MPGEVWQLIEDEVSALQQSIKSFEGLRGPNRRLALQVMQLTTERIKVAIETLADDESLA